MRTARITELRAEIARSERLLALLPSNAVGPSRAEATRNIEPLKALLLIEEARERASAEGRAWNATAFRWALRAGKTAAEAIAAALA